MLLEELVLYKYHVDKNSYQIVTENDIPPCRILINEAHDGDKIAANALLKYYFFCIGDELNIPVELSKYIDECSSKLNNTNSSTNAFNLKGQKSGRHRSENIFRDINVALIVENKIYNESLNSNSAYREAAKELNQKKYKKYRKTMTHDLAGKIYRKFKEPLAFLRNCKKELISISKDKTI